MEVCVHLVVRPGPADLLEAGPGAALMDNSLVCPHQTIESVLP
jgi:hypothetical protein